MADMIEPGPECLFNNCTLVTSRPGATIYSPLAMSLVGIIGNAIELITIHKRKTERQRTVFYVFVAGLAWSDLIGIVITTIPVLLSYSHGYFVGGQAVCNLHAFTMIMMGILTPMIVCAMALERYFGISHGYFYMRHFNPPRARLVLLSLWITSILFAALPTFGFGQYAIQYPGTWCFLNIHPRVPRNSADSAYSITYAIANLLLIITMIICNIMVERKLVTLRCQRQSADRPEQFRRTHRSRKQQEIELQMVIVLLAITLVFTVTWVPLQIQILLCQFNFYQTDQNQNDLLVVRLASFNQLLDPWMYILCKTLCFRKCCTCWTYCQVDRNGSLNRTFSQREMNQISSLTADRFFKIRLEDRPENVPLRKLVKHTESDVDFQEISYHSHSVLKIGSHDLHFESSPKRPSQARLDEQLNETAANEKNKVPIIIFNSTQCYIGNRSMSISRPTSAQLRRSPLRSIAHHIKRRATEINPTLSIIAVHNYEVDSKTFRRRHSWCGFLSSSSTDSVIAPAMRSNHY